jgi:predicted ATPase
MAIIDLYRASDFSDQFESGQYNLFREVVNTPALRDWIEFDDSRLSVRNMTRLNRLFSLVSKETVSDASGEEEEAQAEAELVREPAITTGAQMRELGKIIGDSEAVAVLESTRSLSQAILGASTLTKNQIKRSLELIEDSANTLFAHIGRVSDSDLEKASDIGRTLLNLPALKNKKLMISAGNEDIEREPINLAVNEQFCQFSTLDIVDYKAHKNLRVANLGRINIFAGPNNSGKTSVLEAIYLLTQQSESRALMEVISRRGKLGRDALPKLLFQLTPPVIKIAGNFDHQDTRMEVVLDKDSDAVPDKNGYVGSILMQSTYANYNQSSETHLFDKRDMQRSYSKNPRILCRSLLSSPFSMHDPAVLARVHEKAMERGGKERVIAFLRKWVDTGLRNIELANEFQRFWVSHDDPSRNLDLTHFGEGMQRVFMIALLFAYAEKGVVLIDELENALHTSLLLDFTRFLHELAIEFNVQVFVTSHSKECIDAFVLNGFKLDEVSAYVLVQRDGQTVCIHRSGPELSELLEISDADIRRAR